MKVYIYAVISSILLIGLISSCGKDADTEIEVVDNIPAPEKKVFATVLGLILNADNEFIEGAKVTVGEESVESDENGYFQVSGFFNENGTHILVKKAGYFNGNGLIKPSVDASIKVNVILEDDGSSTDFSATDGAEILIEESSIVFAANGFKDLNDNPFEGTVTVKTKYSDPSGDDFSKKYPGFMLSKESPDKGIFPLSILTVELYDEVGSQLQINQDAELKMKVSDDFLAIAPNTLPLWYLEAETGLWVQEGEAKLEGNHYKGTVSHFSVWVCGLPADLLTVSGSVTKDGQVYPDADMGITYSGNGFKWRTAFRSDNMGNYTFSVLKEIASDYTIDVRSQCGKIIFEESNFSSADSEVTLNIDVEGSDSFKVEGRIYCDDMQNTIANGYALIEFQGSTFSEVVAADSDGHFEFFYEDCGLGRATLRGYDPEEKSKSQAISIVDNTSLSVNVCEEEITSSVTFEVEGEEDYVIPNCTVTVIDSVNGPVNYLSYEFKFTDFFTSYPDVTGEFVEYKFTVNVDKNIEGQPLPPLGPAIEIVSQSENPPRIWTILPFPYEIVSETDDIVIMNIIPDGFFPQGYYENGISTDISNGVFRLEATKN